MHSFYRATLCYRNICCVHVSLWPSVCHKHVLCQNCRTLIFDAKELGEIRMGSPPKRATNADVVS